MSRYLIMVDLNRGITDVHDLDKLDSLTVEHKLKGTIKYEEHSIENQIRHIAKNLGLFTWLCEDTARTIDEIKALNDSPLEYLQFFKRECRMSL